MSAALPKTEGSFVRRTGGHAGPEEGLLHHANPRTWADRARPIPGERRRHDMADGAARRVVENDEHFVLPSARARRRGSEPADGRAHQGWLDVQQSPQWSQQVAHRIVSLAYVPVVRAL